MSDSLNSLIDSLLVGEMKVVKSAIFSLKTEAGNLRLDIFNLAVKGKSTETDALQHHFKGKYSKGRLALEKNKLYKEVVSNLALHRHRNSDWNNILVGIAEVEILMEKGLTEDGLTYCHRLLKRTERQHKLREELAIREIMRKAYKTFDLKKYPAETSYNNNRLQTLAGQLANLVQYQLARDELNVISQTRTRADSAKLKATMRSVMARDILQDERLAQTFDAQLCFHSTWSMYHAALYEAEAGIEHKRKLVSLWEINPERLALEPYLYISALSQLSGSLVVSGRAHLCPPIIEKIKSLKLKSPKHEAFQFKEYQMQFQLYNLNTGNVEAVVKNGVALNEGIQKFRRLIFEGTRVTLQYNSAIAHLLSDDFGPAIRLLTEVIGSGKEMARRDLQSSSMVLRLLLFCWNDEGGTLASDLRTFKRFFKSRTVTGVKEMVEEYVTDHLKVSSKDERRVLLKNLISESEVLKEKRIMAAEEVWLLAKARYDGVPTVKLFQESLKQGEEKKAI